MKELLKKILKALHLYHPLQSFYRNSLFAFKKFYSRQANKKFKGTGFLCNVCCNRYAKFLPSNPSIENSEAIETNHVIAGYGENILCPFCLSTARERLIIAKLKEMAVAGKKILHLSPEKYIHAFIKDKAEVISADLEPGFYRTVDKHVQYADLTNLVFPRDSFDMIIGNHVLEHVPDDRKAIKEIYRVMKQGANAILQVPFSNTITSTIEDPAIDDPRKQSALFGQKDHVRIYYLPDYIGRLQEAGFYVEYTPYDSLQEFHHLAIQVGEGFLAIRK